MHKSTAFRLIAALEQRGLVEQDAERGKYRLGVGILRLAGATTARLDVVQETRPSGSGAGRGAPGRRSTSRCCSDGAALYLDQIAGSSALQSAQLGRPAHPAARDLQRQGPAVRARPPTQIATEVGQRSAPTRPTTITSLKKLLVDVELARQAGYAVAVDELEVGLTAVAAPMRNAHGDVIASL